jgi:hypothetical protein
MFRRKTTDHPRRLEVITPGLSRGVFSRARKSRLPKSATAFAAIVGLFASLTGHGLLQALGLDPFARAVPSVTQRMINNALPAAATKDLPVNTADARSQQLGPQQLLQLERVADRIAEVADIARAELADPPPQMQGLPFTWSRLPSAFALVEIATIIYERLGGPTLPQVKTFVGESKGANPSEIVGNAMSTLTVLQGIAENPRE